MIWVLGLDTCRVGLGVACGYTLFSMAFLGWLFGVQMHLAQARWTESGVESTVTI